MHQKMHKCKARYEVRNPHEAPVRVALVISRNQAAGEQRVALWDVGEDAELLRA